MMVYGVLAIGGLVVGIVLILILVRRQKAHGEQDAVLIVGSWSSNCSHCGRNADPTEQRHEMVQMEGEGCGARFTAIGSDHVTVTESVLKGMRPDLKFVDIFVSGRTM